MAGDHTQQIEYEKQRLYKLVDEMVNHTYEDDEGLPDDLRLDSALIIGAYVWGDSEEDSGYEGIAVHSETKKQYSVRGLIERGLDRVRGAAQSGDAWGDVG